MAAAAFFDFQKHQELIRQRVKFIQGDTIGIVEESLLYHDLEIADMLEVRIFLRTDLNTALSRRLKQLDGGNEIARSAQPRTDHGTALSRRLNQPLNDRESAESAELLEQRKTYFTTVVWQNHIERNGYLFHRNNVEGTAKIKECNDEKLYMQCKEIEGLIGVTVRWATDVSLEVIGPLVRDAGPPNRPDSGSEQWMVQLRRLVRSSIGGKSVSAV